SPGVYETMKPEQKQNLDKFVEEAGLVRVGSLAELEEALEEGYPQLLYYLGHATPDYLTPGEGESITQSDLRNLLRSFDDRERTEGMLAFLNACQTAESGQSGNHLHQLGHRLRRRPRPGHPAHAATARVALAPGGQLHRRLGPVRQPIGGLVTERGAGPGAWSCLRRLGSLGQLR